ncbi:hypothetical protein BBJ28_00007702 [Nothophytophthora sp. Chile5]|nr:hypothetical protein BBJ28_00007702 [Nothophytophthora sp. Chile5]
MGNICHAGPVTLDAGGEAKPAQKPVKPPPTFGKDPTLKREDYIFSNIQTASFLAKLPGSINGQQFLIEDCRDCDIFLLDNCTSVQIDACVNCRIVVGPCQGSVFLRDCKRCTVVCAVQQFRARDCEDVSVYLYSATAGKNTPGSVAMEFQGSLCYQHVNETLQDPRFAAEVASGNSLFVSKDTATALYAQHHTPSLLQEGFPLWS